MNVEGKLDNISETLRRWVIWSTKGEGKIYIWFIYIEIKFVWIKLNNFGQMDNQPIHVLFSFPRGISLLIGKQEVARLPFTGRLKKSVHNREHNMPQRKFINVHWNVSSNFLVGGRNHGTQTELFNCQLFNLAYPIFLKFLPLVYIDNNTCLF